jgi:hypothetical protein
MLDAVGFDAAGDGWELPDEHAAPAAMHRTAAKVTVRLIA